MACLAAIITKCRIDDDTAATPVRSLDAEVRVAKHVFSHRPSADRSTWGDLCPRVVGSRAARGQHCFVSNISSPIDQFVLCVVDRLPLCEV